VSQTGTTSNERRPLARAAVAVLLAGGIGALLGCGEAKIPVHVVRSGARGQSSEQAAAPGQQGSRAQPSSGAGPSAGADGQSGAGQSSVGRGGAGGKPATGAPTGADGRNPAPVTAEAAKHRAIVAKVDVSSDAALAEGKVHIAEGAPSDAEVRREVQTLRKAGIVLPSGDTAASFANAQANSNAYAAGAQTPDVVWNPRLKPIAAWIVPVLEWAYTHGWRGAVTSGYRTYVEQAQLNAAGAFSAPAGYSNHETTAYPGGAVDVSNPSQLIAVLRGYPGPEKLVGGVLGPVDPEHFSATGA
jgi:hypothetical protein